MKNAVSFILTLWSVATGALFIYSAYSKAYPIQPFEYTMVEYLRFPWLLSALAARFFVGLELGIGLLLIGHLYGKGKWVLQLAAALLVIFSGYLVFLWVEYGDHINCGCFGDKVWVSPSASLLKNGALLIIIVFLIRFHLGINPRWSFYVNSTIIVASITLPFILLAMPFETTDHIDLSPLYAAAKADKPSVNIARGKYVIAFLNPGCSHCRNTASLMHRMKQKYPRLPLFMIIGGETSDLTEFWKATSAQDIPYIRLDKDNFLRYTGGVFPVILWINSSRIEARPSYKDMTAEAVYSWAKK